MTDFDTAAALERSLTVSGRGRQPGGMLHANTLRAYAKYWTRAREWVASVGLSTVTAWSSETLARYASVLLEQGYATGTVDAHLAAIKAGHRKRGWVVPDPIAAWYVLRGAKNTALMGAKVNTPRSRRESLASALQHLKASREGEIRDLCLFTLGWDLMARASDLVALDLADVESDVDEDGETFLMVRLAGRWLEVHHLHDPVEVCPVEATLGWFRALGQHGVTSGALFRPVDKGGNIAGSGDPYAGHQFADRLTDHGVRQAWRRLVRQGQLPESTARDMRRASAIEAALAGVSIGWILDRGGWSPRGDMQMRLAAAVADQQRRDAEAAR